MFAVKKNVFVGAVISTGILATGVYFVGHVLKKS